MFKTGFADIVSWCSERCRKEAREIKLEGLRDILRPIISASDYAIIVDKRNEKEKEKIEECEEE